MTENSLEAASINILPIVLNLSYTLLNNILDCLAMLSTADQGDSWLARNEFQEIISPMYKYGNNRLHHHQKMYQTKKTA